MQISYNWLKSYIKVEEDVQYLAEILTDIGLEVGGIEEIESIKGGLKGLVIGEVKEKWQHPNADKLSCTKVDVGADELLQIVCGAPNVAEGQKVVVATVGTELFSGEDSFKIKKSKLRGELSEGMICAEDEIGMGKSHEGIMVLPKEVKVGTLASDYFEVETDTLIEIDITPNRADALSHIGVARDLAAYFTAKGNKTEYIVPKVDFKSDHNNPITIELKDTDACPYYSGIYLDSIIVKDSPNWLKKRLTSIGLTPVNNVVDVTNFVLHEVGQPLHAFDGEKINSNTIIVGKGCTQKFKALDEQVVDLNSDDLMVSNTNEPMCIAGVFGGLDSGVNSTTKSVFIESAYFNPTDVRRSSKRHDFKTDASYRFERGVNPQMIDYALKRCVVLLQEVADAKGISEVVSKGLLPSEFFDVEFRPAYCNQLLGTTLSDKEIKNILLALDIQVDDSDATWKLKVPSYRVDVQREVDVIEDVLRIYGYNSVEIPNQFKASINYTDGLPTEVVQTKISDYLTANGCSEILNNSLTKKAYYENFEDLSKEQVELLNPLSQDLAIMRKTLLFGGLESVARNQNMKNPNCKLYEFGKTYKKTGEHAYEEKKHLAIFLSGLHHEPTWNQAKQLTDFNVLSGWVNGILEQLNIQKIKLKETQSDLMSYAIDYQFKKETLVTLGKVNPKVAKLAGVKQAVFYADFNWDLVLKLAKYLKSKYQPLPKFHPVARDLSLLIDEGVTYDKLVKAVKETEKKYLKEVALFDVYQGEKLPKGKKSYTLSFTLESEDKTLKDQEIDKVMTKLQEMFKDKFNAELR